MEVKLYLLERVEDCQPNIFVGVYESRELARQALVESFLDKLKEQTRCYEKEDFQPELLTATLVGNITDSCDLFGVIAYYKGEPYTWSDGHYEISVIGLNETDKTEVF